MNKLVLGTLVSLAFSAASAPLALAQVANPAPGTVLKEQRMHRDHGQRAFKPTQEVEARLAYIRTALKITPAQEPQWNAFADTLRKQAAAREQQMQERRAQFAQRTERTRPNAVSRLEFQKQRFEAALARLNERIAVQKPLYAALSAEQQAIADEVLAPRRHGRHGPGHRGMHGRG